MTLHLHLTLSKRHVRRAGWVLGLAGTSAISAVAACGPRPWSDLVGLGLAATIVGAVAVSIR